MEQNNIVLFQSKDGQTRLEVKQTGESVWLRQEQIAELFGKDVSGVSRHIAKIFKDGELDEKSNLQKMQIAFSDKPVNFYSLDVILAVGYRANSRRAIEFRRWATSILKEYLIKGFAMDDERLKQLGGGGLRKTLHYIPHNFAGQSFARLCGNRFMGGNAVGTVCYRGYVQSVNKSSITIW